MKKNIDETVFGGGTKRTKIVQKRVLSLIILMLFLGLLGFSYAWFSNIVEQEGKDIVITTARLGIVYADGPDVSVSNIYPGESITKTFTVENQSRDNATYELYFKDLVNTFIDNEIVYTLYEESLGELISNAPLNMETIKSNIAIGPNETHRFTLTILFKETDSNQNSNMGALLSTTIQIGESHFVDIEEIETTHNTITVKAIEENFKGIEGYKYSIDNGVSWTELITSEEYTFTNLSFDTEYEIKVKIIEKDGYELISGSLRIRTSEVNPPAISLTLDSKTFNSITVTATASDAVVGIKPTTYQFSKDNGETWTTAQASNTYQFTGLSQSTTYYIKARVQNNEDMTSTTEAMEVATGVFSSAFTYTGTHTTSEDTTYSYIQMKTNGTLVLNGSWTYDVFLVGGGGGGSLFGGGGGYTKTYKNLTISNGTSIPVIVGSGGAKSSADNDGSIYIYATDGGFSQYYNSSYRANGGYNGNSRMDMPNSGSGGSGGSCQMDGGSNGSNGSGASLNYCKGQGTTTRAFGEASGALYAGGGASTSIGLYCGVGGSGGGAACNTNAAANTGGGGGGHLCSYGEGGICSRISPNSGAGGSGIVILRIRK